jgi:hypothetical protein
MKQFKRTMYSYRTPGGSSETTQLKHHQTTMARGALSTNRYPAKTKERSDHPNPCNS